MIHEAISKQFSTEVICHTGVIDKDRAGEPIQLALYYAAAVTPIAKKECISQVKLIAYATTAEWNLDSLYYWSLQHTEAEIDQAIKTLYEQLKNEIGGTLLTSLSAELKAEASANNTFLDCLANNNLTFMPDKARQGFSSKAMYLPISDKLRKDVLQKLLKEKDKDLSDDYAIITDKRNILEKADGIQSLFLNFDISVLLYSATSQKLRFRCEEIQPFIIIEKKSGQVVGFVELNQLTEHCFAIEQLVVRPDKRGLGLATFLMQNVFDAIPTGAALFFTAGNTELKDKYSQLGAQTIADSSAIDLGERCHIYCKGKIKNVFVDFYKEKGLSAGFSIMGNIISSAFRNLSLFNRHRQPIVADQYTQNDPAIIPALKQ